MTKRLVLLGTLLVLAVSAALILVPRLQTPIDVTEKPARSVESVTAPEVPLSYASITLSLSIEELRRQVREQLSEKVLAGKAKIANRNIDVTVEKNGPFAIWVKGDTVRMRLPIKFKARGDLKTKGKLTIFSSVKYGIGEDWQPNVKVRSTFEWDWQPRVGIWPFRFRVGDRMAPYIQKALDQGGEEMRKNVEGSVKVRDLAESSWKRLYEPRQLGSQPPVWLMQAPHGFYLAPITSDQYDINLTVWLASRMSLVEGVQPAAQAVPPLPPLAHGLPPEKGFAIPYTQVMSYAAMVEQLKQSLVGQPVAVGGGSVVPVDFELYPSGSELVLRMPYEGHAPSWWQSSRGTLYFRGKPEYDAQGHTYTLSNLHLTDASANPMAFLSTWTTTGSLAEAIAPKLTWDLAPATEKAKTDTAKFLNETVVGGYDLWGTVKQFELQGVATGETGLNLSYLAKGDMSILFVP